MGNERSFEDMSFSKECISHIISVCLPYRIVLWYLKYMVYDASNFKTKYDSFWHISLFHILYFGSLSVKLCGAFKTTLDQVVNR